MCKVFSTGKAVLPVLCWFMLLGMVNAQETCGFRDVYNKDGWPIPGIEKAKVVSVSHWERDGVTFQTEYLQPRKREALLVAVGCSANVPGRLRVETRAVNVLKLWRYSYQGRVFAYLVTAENVSMEGRKRVRLSSVETPAYYDDDGDGRFRLQEFQTPIPYFVRIPDWIKLLAQSDVAQ